MKSISLSVLFGITFCLPIFSQSITSTALKAYCIEINAIQLGLDGETFTDPKDQQTYELFFPKENFDILYSSGIGYKAEYMKSETEILYVSEGIDLSVADAVTPKPVNPRSAVQVIQISFADKSVVRKMIENGKLIKTTAYSYLNFYYKTGNISQKTRLINALKGIVKLLSTNFSMYHQSNTGMITFPDGKYTGTFVGVNKRREGNGTFNFNDGSVYTGEWKDDKMHGRGKLKSNQIVEISGDRVKSRKGIEYEGYWIEGMLQGKGTARDNEIYYEGNFVDGRVTGRGKLIYNKDDKWAYDGEWKDFMFHGKGTWSRDQTYIINGVHYGKETYMGDFVLGVREGKGLLTYGPGYVVEGVWSNGISKGQGEITFSRGKYVGDIVLGKRHGYGIYTGEDYTYTGKWNNGERQGQGEQIERNGDHYIGMWRNDWKDGKGVMNYANGEKYDGEWKSGYKYKGSQTWNNGTTYTGDWSKDTMHGAGIMLYANGDKYEGGWANGKPYGIGVFYDKTNNEIKNIGLNNDLINKAYLRSKTKALNRDNTYFVNYLLTDSTLILYVPKNFSHVIHFDLQNDQDIDDGFDIKYQYVLPGGNYYRYFIKGSMDYSKRDLLPSRRDTNDIFELTFQLNDIVNLRRTIGILDPKEIAFQISFTNGEKKVFLPKRKQELDFTKGSMYYIKPLPKNSNQKE